MGTLPGKSLTCHILLFLSVIISVNAYSKYGRSCNDIGCLPSEQCVLAQDSCSYTQRDGKDCGSYPTCKRKAAGSNQSPGANLNPAPDNTRINQSPNQNPNYNPAPHIDPNNVFGQPNNNNQMPNQWGNFPIFPNPTPRQQQPQVPQYYPPQNPYNSYGGSGYQPPNSQYPYAFGNPASGGFANYPSYPKPTKEPSLFDQFLYNKQGGRKNASPSLFCSSNSSNSILLTITSIVLTMKFIYGMLLL